MFPEEIYSFGSVIKNANVKAKLPASSALTTQPAAEIVFVMASGNVSKATRVKRPPVSVVWRDVETV
jgi:hypothetical protein